MYRVLAVTVGIGALTVGCSLGADSAKVGAVFELGNDDFVETSKSSAFLPSGEYDFKVSKPMAEVSPETADGASIDQDAADGTSFVTIEWTGSALNGEPSDLLAPRDDVLPRLTLVADDKDYDLGEIEHSSDGPKVVTVSGTPKQVDLELEYAGRSEVVDAYADSDATPTFAGRELPSLTSAKCPERPNGYLANQVYFGGSKCSVRYSDLMPYHGAFGWAPEGKAFVVVDASTDRPAYFARDAVDYETEYGALNLTLDGQQPAKPTEHPYTGELADGIKVFEVDADARSLDFRLTQRYFGVVPDDQRASAKGAPDPVSFTHDVRGSLAFRETP